MWVRPQTHIKTSLELKMTCLRVSAASSRATLAASPRLWLNPPSFSYISLPSHSRGCVINMKPCVTAVNRGSSFPDHPHRNVWPHGGLTRRPNLGAHGAAAFYPTLNRTLSSHRWLLVRLHGEQAPCSSPFFPLFFILSCDGFHPWQHARIFCKFQFGLVWIEKDTVCAVTIRVIKGKLTRLPRLKHCSSAE